MSILNRFFKHKTKAQAPIKVVDQEAMQSVIEYIYDSERTDFLEYCDNERVHPYDPENNHIYAMLHRALGLEYDFDEEEIREFDDAFGPDVAQQHLMDAMDHRPAIDGEDDLVVR